MNRKNDACLTTVAVVILIWSLLFNVYIVRRFLLHPRAEWRSVSNYGLTMSGSMTILVHWLGGMVVNALGPLQVMPALRRRWPRMHRWAGCTYALALMTASVAGLAYIWVRRTVGGLQMDVCFTLYGSACFVAGAGAGRYGWRRDRGPHRRWALRAFSLGFGSAFYRLLILPIDTLSIDDWITYLNAAGWGMWAPYCLVEARLAYEQWSDDKAERHRAIPMEAVFQPANKSMLV